MKKPFVLPLLAALAFLTLSSFAAAAGSCAQAKTFGDCAGQKTVFDACENGVLLGYACEWQARACVEAPKTFSCPSGECKSVQSNGVEVVGCVPQTPAEKGETGMTPPETASFRKTLFQPLNFVAVGMAALLLLTGWVAKRKK